MADRSHASVVNNDIPAAPIVNGKKTFIPIGTPDCSPECSSLCLTKPPENNPETIGQLARAIGVSDTITFHDVLSVTDPALLALVPRPVLALIFLCHEQTYYVVRDKATPHVSPYRGSGPHEPVTWIRQTIGHSCGSMALIHAMANGPARTHVRSGSVLDDLLTRAVPLEPEERAKLLYESNELERAHMTAAVQGDSIPPRPEDPNGLHYIAFVKGDDGRLWELEGGFAGPIEWGTLKEDEDALSEAAIRMGVAKFIEAGKQIENLQFSIVAVVENQS